MAEVHKLNLRDNMVEMVPYPEDVAQAVAEAALLWQAFCALPDGIKQAFAAMDPQLTVGYEAKDGSGESADRKENFDFSMRGANELQSVLDRVDDDTARRFIEATQKLQQLMLPMIESFGVQVETEYDVENFADLARRSAPDAFFRFLHYPAGGAVGDEIAELHTDHSGFTFHLFETTDGCLRLTPDGKMEPLPVAEGQAAAFSSMQLQLVSGGDLKAMAHEVIANEDCVRLGRYAIVCFVALAKVPVYDRKGNGRLQDLHKQKPGFNYHMPRDEFRRLFQ